MQPIEPKQEIDAEATDLKSVQSGFESRWEHPFNPLNPSTWSQAPPLVPRLVPNEFLISY